MTFTWSPGEERRLKDGGNDVLLSSIDLGPLRMTERGQRSLEWVVRVPPLCRKTVGARCPLSLGPGTALSNSPCWAEMGGWRALRGGGAWVGGCGWGCRGI